MCILKRAGVDTSDGPEAALGALRRLRVQFAAQLVKHHPIQHARICP